MSGGRFIDRTDSAIADWVARHGNHIAEAMGIELTDAVKTSMDPGPGPRTGREYTKPGTRATYTASAPGEHPAVREGALRDSFHALPVTRRGDLLVSGTGSALTTEDGEHNLATVLNNGTDDGRIQPRPFLDTTLADFAARHNAQVRE